jgi:hypothetical protein
VNPFFDANQRNKVANDTLADVAAAAKQLLEKNDATLVSVSRKMGVVASTLQRLTQPDHNSTLDTLAKLAWATGHRLVVRFEKP